MRKSVGRPARMFQQQQRPASSVGSRGAEGLLESPQQRHTTSNQTHVSAAVADQQRCKLVYYFEKLACDGKEAPSTTLQQRQIQKSKGGSSVATRKTDALSGSRYSYGRERSQGNNQPYQAPQARSYATSAIGALICTQRGPRESNTTSATAKN